MSELEHADARRRGVAVEAGRAERALRRLYPALARALGPRDVARLARELVHGHPFAFGTGGDFAALWPDFLAASLEDDSRHGPWLCELARFEEALDGLARPGWEAPPLRCEHRVDEVHGELLAGGVWQAPRPARVVFAFERGPDGARALARGDTDASVVPAALPRRA